MDNVLRMWYNVDMNVSTNLLTRKEKADELGISERTLDRRIRQQKIQVIQIKGSYRKFFLPEVVDEAN